MNSLKRSLVAIAVLLSIQAICAHADTDALFFPASSNVIAVGYFNLGVGWSFVPSTNLVVTWVGYEDSDGYGEWAADARVTFWTSTNTPLAAYSSASLISPVEIDSNSVPYGMVYGKISPLALMAMGEYSITLDRGSNAQVLEDFSSDLSVKDSRPFQAASELSYLGIDEYDVTKGWLKPWASSATGLLLGPTFRFLVAAEVVPRLEIELSGEGVALAWPTNAPDCVVESSTSLVGAVWEQVANAPTIIGNRYVSPYQFADNRPRFFRLRLR
jgi:hypothetical protein